MTTVKASEYEIYKILSLALHNLLSQEIPAHDFDVIMAANQYIIDNLTDKTQDTFEIKYYDDLKAEFEIWQKAHAMKHLVKHKSASENAKLWDKLNER